MSDATPAEARRRRREEVLEAAAAQGGVLSRRQISALAVTPKAFRSELAASRWHPLGRHPVMVDPCAEQDRGRLWATLIAVSPRAVLAGMSALIEAGLTGITSEAIHVAVPKSSRPRRLDGVIVHETRRLQEWQVRRTGLPRQVPAFAAVHGALWAVSDRQAAMLLAASVQQRLVYPADLVDAVATVRRHRRRRLLSAVVADVCGGAESIGELDFAAMCRARGIPEPDRQVTRRLPSGRVIYDARWDRYCTTAEIDGVGHLSVTAQIPDALKQNAAGLGGDRLVRIPVIALRIDPDPFFAQLEDALRQGGWPG